MPRNSGPSESLFVMYATDIFMHVVIQSGGGGEACRAFLCKLNERSPAAWWVLAFYSVLAWPGTEQGYHCALHYPTVLQMHVP